MLEGAKLIGAGAATIALAGAAALFIIIVLIEGKGFILNRIRRRRPQPASSTAPDTSGTDGGGEKDPRVLLRAALRRFKEISCSNNCDGRSRCGPKCLEHMSEEQRKIFVREFLKKYE